MRRYSLKLDPLEHAELEKKRPNFTGSIRQSFSGWGSVTSVLAYASSLRKIIALAEELPGNTALQGHQGNGSNPTGTAEGPTTLCRRLMRRGFIDLSLASGGK